MVTDKRSSKRLSNRTIRNSTLLTKRRKHVKQSQCKGVTAKEDIAMILLSCAKVLSYWNIKARRYLLTKDAAVRVQRWYKKELARKLWSNLIRFSAVVMNVRWQLALNIKIKVKRRSVRIIRYILERSLASGKAANIVSLYIGTIRKIQGFMRDFLACRKAKMQILRKIWKIEALTFEKEVKRSINESQKMNIIKLKKLNRSSHYFGSSKSALKKVNADILDWKETDKKAKKLCRGRARSKLGNIRPPSVKQISSSARDSILLALISQARIQRSKPERIRNRVQTIFKAKDMLKMYNLQDATVGVRKEIDLQSVTYTRRPVAVSLFWSTLAKREGSISGYIRQIYHDTYIKCYGDPFLKFQRNQRSTVISNIQRSRARLTSRRTISNLKKN